MEFGFGSGILTATRNDLSGVQTPERFGALQDVSVEFNGDIKELFATQQFPVDVARGKTKIMGKAKVAEIKGAMYNSIFFGQTLATGSVKYAYNESLSQASTVSFTYTVANAGSTPLTDQGVFYVANGNQLAIVSTAPTIGQYEFAPATGVYTFGTEPQGTGLFVNYLYTVVGGFNIAIGNPFMGTTPQFKTVLFQQFEGNQVVLILNKCVSSRLTFPTRIDDYVIQDVDFSAFADAGGSVGAWNTSN
jgi:hypothetical protein